MTSGEKVERYLNTLSINVEQVGADTWIINDPSKGLRRVVVAAVDPVVVIRVKVMEAPVRNREKFFETLLALNAGDMPHGAYGLEGNDVVIVDTLRAETMDLEELQASLDAVGLSLAAHAPLLQEYRT